MNEFIKINWNDLKFFCIVARCGTLAVASDRLNVNHSTVFRRINTLESVLGVKLFDRTGDGYKLSKIGLETYDKVEHLANTIHEIQGLTNSYSNKLQGNINLTAPHNFAYRYLPQVIHNFQAEYPDITINLLVTNKDCDLSKREADLAIRASSSPPEHLIGIKLFSFHWSIYASPSYLEKFGRPKNEQELKNHKLISVYQDLGYLPAFRWVQKNIPEENVVSRCNDLISMAALAMNGTGLAILPDDQNTLELEKIFEVDFADDSTMWLLNHPNMRDCLRLKTFKRYLIDSFNNNPDIQSNIASS